MMNMKGEFGSRVPGMSLMVNPRKNDKMRSVVKDEDLTLFRDLNKDGIISLLHPLSDELFDHSIPNPNGRYSCYMIMIIL